MIKLPSKQAFKLINDFQNGGLSRRQFIARSSALVGAGLFSISGIEQVLAATPQKGGHMKVAMAHGNTSDTLDPATIENGLQWVAVHGVGNTLTEVAPDGTLIPSLASSWEASADAKTWVFKIRQDVEFHNGKTMTIDDVIASINYHRGEESKSAGKPVMAGVTELRADGPETLIIELSGGNADFPFNFNEAFFTVYPAKDNAIDWQGGGSGPYKIKNYDPGVRIDFERNPNYWKEGHAHADTIELLTITDPAARSSALITGEVHVIDQVDLKTVELLARNPAITILEGAGPLHYTFPMATNVAPFDNVDVRKALKYAINREEMVEKILQGHGVVGNDNPIGPSYRYYAADIEQTSYDPDKAKFHLKEAGLSDLSVDLSAADSAFAGAVDAVQLYQASAAKAGININVIRESNDGYWSDVWMKKPWAASYWGGYSTEDAMFTTGYSTGAAWNDTFWSNEQFEKLLVQSRAELDEAKRAEMYREMQILVRDEGGVVAPMFANSVMARNDKVGHGELSWIRPTDGRRMLERWWVA